MSTEIERLKHGVKSDENPTGMGTVRFIVKCNGNAVDVLKTAKQALIAILELAAKRCDDEGIWASTLPERFVRACRPFPSKEEIEAFNKLPLDERVKRDGTEPWSLRELINAFVVLERWWFWWDAVILDENHIAVAVEVPEWPFPWGALRRLFLTSGASDVIPEP